MPARRWSGQQLFALVLFCLGLSSCTAESYRKSADDEVRPILDALDQSHIQTRKDTVQLPKTIDPSVQKSLEMPSNPEARKLVLKEILKIATEQNRDLMSQRESLYLSALSLTLTRYNFGPKFTGVISYLYANATGTPSEGTGSANLTGSSVLPTGGSLSVSGNSSVTGNDGIGLDSNKQYTSDLTTSLTQPLWRGAGYESSHEALTAAERGTVYAIRSFELFREDFTIQVLTRYYNLVSQKRVIENQKQNLEQFQFLRRRSEALFQVGRTPQLDVFRARQQELSAQNSLEQAVETYQAALAQFRIFLGFAPESPIEISEEQPSFTPVWIEEESAVQVALNNRLDLMTAKDQLEDAERGVRIAGDELGPDLSLALSHTLTAPSTPHADDLTYKDQSWSAGLTLSLPLDRKAERNSYRTALISRDRQQRSYQQQRDAASEEVRSSLRRLRRSGNALDIQKSIIESEQKRLKIAQIRFRAGEIENRDVVEAQQGLLSAQNSYIQELVNYEISRIQLKRDLGTLFLGPDGVPQE